MKKKNKTAPVRINYIFRSLRTSKLFAPSKLESELIYRRTKKVVYVDHDK